MIKYKDFLNEQLKNNNFKYEYDKLQPEFEIICAIIRARETCHMTQKELAEKTGINQADISKIENGTRNPSIKLLQRLAEGMGMVLKIEFIPKENFH